MKPPEITIPGLEEAENMQTLGAAIQVYIEANGLIPGTGGKTYSFEDIVSKIGQVEQSRKLNILPRAGGIRAKVENLSEKK